MKNWKKIFATVLFTTYIKNFKYMNRSQKSMKKINSLIEKNAKDNKQFSKKGMIIFSPIELASIHNCDIAKSMEK